MPRVHAILSESGFRPGSATSRIVHDSIREAFEMCGESAAEVLMYNLEQIHRMPREAIMARYDLVEKSIKAVFGYGADLIIENIRRNLLKAMPGADPSLSPTDIINRAHEQEILDFLRNVGEHEHVVFIHETDKVGDSMLNSFLDPSFEGSKGAILSRARSLDRSVASVRYDELFRKDRPDWMKSLTDWISELGSGSRGYGTRLAGEDDSWFFRNGFEDEIISLEQALGPRVKDRMSVLCTYRLADLSEEHLREVARTHSYVIVDDPPTLYKAGGGGHPFDLYDSLRHPGGHLIKNKGPSCRCLSILEFQRSHIYLLV